MEEQLSSLAVTHLLQHTLRSLCIHENSQWVYAVFWRILPRNYPPPKWDCQGGAYDRSRGNRRNWILVWEDGFCNFAASSSSSAAAADHQINNINGGDHECPSSSASHVYIGNSCDYNNNNHQLGGLQPELFFKMSHEIYNYGEGLIGKVAADHSHKWIYKEPNNQEINFLSAWHNSADSHPRTWEAQFQSGIKTIALIAVREGVIQLGSVQKVIEDLSYVVLLRKKFSYIESIPGVLLPHPSSSSTSAAYHPFIKIDGGYPVGVGGGGGGEGWHHFHHGSNLLPPQPVPPPPPEFYDHHHNYHHHHQVPMKITPSMSSLEALLSKLPSVVVPTSSSSPAPPVAAAAYQEAQQHHPHYVMMGMDQKVVTKEEFDQEDQDQDQEIDDDQKKNGDQDQDHDHQSSSRVSSYNHHHHHHHPHPHFVSQESMHSHGY